MQFFTASRFYGASGLLSKFCKRHHISYKTIVGEAGLVDRAVTDEYLKDVLPGLLADYNPSDIFNADQTTLFYRAQPAKTMINKHMDANKANKQCK